MCLIEPEDLAFVFVHMDAIYACVHVSHLLALR